MNICQQVLLSQTLLPSSQTEKASEKENDNSRKQLVENTCTFLLNNLDKQHTLMTISRYMHTNKNILSQAFKQQLDIGVSAWLRNKRMEFARELLLQSDLSIQDIAAQVGYSNQANFSTTFKAFYHSTPLNIRKQK